LRRGRAADSCRSAAHPVAVGAGRRPADGRRAGADALVRAAAGGVGPPSPLQVQNHVEPLACGEGLAALRAALPLWAVAIQERDTGDTVSALLLTLFPVMTRMTGISSVASLPTWRPDPTQTV